MKLTVQRLIRHISLLFILPAMAQAQLAAPNTLAGLAAFHVESVQVADISPQGITISVKLSLTPTRTITIESFRLSSLRMNGLPLFAAPLTSPLQLTAGKSSTIPPLVVKVLFRDLNSVAPLRKMLEEETVHIQGQAQAVVRLGFLERLALHTEHPIISIPISENVPVSIGGSLLARQAALGALTLVESALEAASTSGMHLPGTHPAWVEALETRAPGALVQVETQYTITENKTPYPVLFDQLAFRLDRTPLLTTPEARAPWEYDPDFLARIHSKEARLDTATLNIQLTPLALDSPSPTLQLNNGDFTLQERGSPDQDRVLVSAKGRVSVKVRRRASPDALLLFIPTHPGTDQGLFPASDDVLHQDRWEKLAVFRLIPSTSGTASPIPTVEIIQLSGHREGKLIRFEDPVDPSAFGSPVLTPQGVLGIVQDETTGAFLPSGFTNLPPPR